MREIKHQLFIDISVKIANNADESLNPEFHNNEQVQSFQENQDQLYCYQKNRKSDSPNLDSVVGGDIKSVA
jgi:hypothetical protein